MLENLLSGLVGAIIGAVLTLAGTWFIMSRLQKQELVEAKRNALELDMATRLLQFLAKVLNREAPDSLKKQASDLKQEWGHVFRALYLMNVPDPLRHRLDDRMMQYLESLRHFAQDPTHRTEVERQRGRIREEAREILRQLRIVPDWE